MKIVLGVREAVIGTIITLLLIACVFAYMAATGAEFKPEELIKQASFSNLKVDGTEFQNGTAIEWSNLQIGANEKTISLRAYSPCAISIIFPDLPNGVTVSCPLNNTYLTANVAVQNYLILTMTPEAGSNGAEMSTLMYILVQEVEQ